MDGTKERTYALHNSSFLLVFSGHMSTQMSEIGHDLVSSAKDPSAASHTHPPPVARLLHLMYDLITSIWILWDPLPALQGFRYLLTVVDRFMRWPEAIPLMDITATSVARAFVFVWVTWYGVPFVLTMDLGRHLSPLSVC